MTPPSEVVHIDSHPPPLSTGRLGWMAPNEIFEPTTFRQIGGCLISLISSVLNGLWKVMPGMKFGILKQQPKIYAVRNILKLLLHLIEQYCLFIIIIVRYTPTVVYDASTFPTVFILKTSCPPSLSSICLFRERNKNLYIFYHFHRVHRPSPGLSSELYSRGTCAWELHNPERACFNAALHCCYSFIMSVFKLLAILACWQSINSSIV